MMFLRLARDEAAFKEGDHPRGQPANKGQFAPSGGSGGSSKSGIEGTGNGAKPQPDFRDSLAFETKEDTTQPVKSVDELYERAAKAEPAFKKNIEDMAAKYGGQAQFTPEAYAEPGSILKSRSSAERKVGTELGGDVTKLRDVLRGTIVGGSVESTRKAAADFVAEHRKDILRVKDRYVDKASGGYRDILINYRTPDGLVAEVQFNSKNMVTAKNETAHKIYEQIRELPPADATPALLVQLERKMGQIYRKAYLADGNGNWRKAAAAPAKDAETSPPEGDILRRYKLTPPSGDSFEAVIKKAGEGIAVESNRSGKWAPEEEIKFADLIAPEQAMEEWEVELLETSDPLTEEELDAPEPEGDGKPLAFLPESEGDDTPEVLAQRANDRRPVRDVGDIEYYTLEALGPRRELTPEGFLICYDVPAARVGEMIYAPGEVPQELGVGKDGRIRITRSEAEVFDPRSMASLNGKPVTDEHPPVDVDPRNWKFYTKGVVVNPRRGVGEHKDFLMVDMIIYDAEMIEDIDKNKREVSCGYNPEYMQLLDRDTGEVIVGRGEQTKIRYNHLALVLRGRCGPFCSIGDSKTVDRANDNNDGFWSPARAARLRRLGRARH